MKTNLFYVFAYSESGQGKTIDHCKHREAQRVYSKLSASGRRCAYEGGPEVITGNYAYNCDYIDSFTSCLNKVFPQLLDGYGIHKKDTGRRLPSIEQIEAVWVLWKIASPVTQENVKEL